SPWTLEYRCDIRRNHHRHPGRPLLREGAPGSADRAGLQRGRARLGRTQATAHLVLVLGGTARRQLSWQPDGGASTASDPRRTLRSLAGAVARDLRRGTGRSPRRPDAGIRATHRPQPEVRTGPASAGAAIRRADRERRQTVGARGRCFWLDRHVVHQSKSIARQRAPTGVWSASAQRLQRRLVIRLVGDLADQLGVDHLVVVVQHHHRARSQPGQRTLGYRHAVIVEELAAAHQRQVDHVLQALGAAEARLRERKVGRDAQHHGIVELAGRFVEVAHRRRASRRIDAGEDIEHLALAGKARQRGVGQIARDQRKRRSGRTHGWKATVDADRLALESDTGHAGTPVWKDGYKYNMVLARKTIPTISASTMRWVCLNRQTSILPRRIAHIALANTPSTPNASNTLSNSQLPKREPTQAKPSQRMSNSMLPLTNSRITTTGMYRRTRAITACSMRCTVTMSKCLCSDSSTITSNATAPTNTIAQDRCSRTIHGYQASMRKAKRGRQGLQHPTHGQQRP